MDSDSLAALLERGLSLAEIARRFGRHESTVAYWVKKHGLQAANVDHHASRGGLPRELLEPLVLESATIAEIAVRVGRSAGTVRHWLKRYGLRTASGRGRRPSARAVAGKRAGMVVVAMPCPRHGTTEFALNGRGFYRCKLCRAEAVTRRRRKVKAILVEEAGGACHLCGYSKSMRALHFHHLEPGEKRMGINAGGAGVSLERLREEARKCVLLCSNCHAEVEHGLVTLKPADRLPIQ